MHAGSAVGITDLLHFIQCLWADIHTWYLPKQYLHCRPGSCSLLCICHQQLSGTQQKLKLAMEILSYYAAMQACMWS